MIHKIQEILSEFESISLKQMDSVKLMDRTDTKFTFTLIDLLQILPNLLNEYQALEIEGKKMSSYKTLYYDTPELKLYNAHHNGKLNRYKIRHRTYLETGVGFLEVKFKSNKGRTVKERISTLIPESNWDQKQINFLNSKLPFSPETLLPVIWVNYTRITLVSKSSAERLTIDINLNFNDSDNKIDLTNLVIAEVKRAGKAESIFIKKLKQKHIREGSISKYCMAVALSKKNVRKNNFKERLLNLKKIMSYDFIASN